MIKIYSFCLHASPEVLSLLGNSIVDNPLIQSHQHTRLHSYHIMSSDSPDLNPAYYKVWSVAQEQVYQTPIHDVNDLKQRFLDVWAGVDQKIISYFVNYNFGR